MTMPPDAIRAALKHRLDVLTRRAGAITADLRQPGHPDWSERAVEMENDDVLEGLDEATRAEAAQLRAALARLAAGSYGRCARCGREIGAARLEAIPSATTCVACAQP
jgi:RNA polymerase-binding transcription factor DksA